MMVVEIEGVRHSRWTDAIPNITACGIWYRDVRWARGNRVPLPLATRVEGPVDCMSCVAMAAERT